MKNIFSSWRKIFLEKYFFGDFRKFPEIFGNFRDFLRFFGEFFSGNFRGENPIFFENSKFENLKMYNFLKFGGNEHFENFQSFEFQNF